MEKKIYTCDRCESDQVIAGRRYLDSYWTLILDMNEAYVYRKHVCSVQCACLIDNPTLAVVAVSSSSPDDDLPF